jgi:glyoxylase-like metal-dependent hydrolase (beta-lactamase superfamily II)
MTIYRNFLLTVLVFASTTMAQESEVSFKSSELAPGLYMLEGQGGFAGGNIGLLTGDDGVVVIDAGLEPLTAVTVSAIEAITAEPLDFLINTHAHGDHVGGNAALHEQGASIVAHEKLRNRMVVDNAPRDALPELTYTGEVTFHLNGHTARVFHVANAHTDGDSVIHFPEVNVIHAGDAMFNKLFPFIDLDSGGSVSGYIAAQKKILSMANNQTKIVPGHGVLANKADLQAALDMLLDSQARVKTLVDAGKSKEEILTENPLADYHNVWNWGFITTERMTETLYRSLTSN